MIPSAYIHLKGWSVSTMQPENPAINTLFGLISRGERGIDRIIEYRLATHQIWLQLDLQKSV